MPDGLFPSRLVAMFERSLAEKESEYPSMHNLYQFVVQDSLAKRNKWTSCEPLKQVQAEVSAKWDRLCNLADELEEEEDEVAGVQAQAAMQCDDTEMRLSYTLALQRRMPYNFRAVLSRKDKKQYAAGANLDPPENVSFCLVKSLILF